MHHRDGTASIIMWAVLISATLAGCGTPESVKQGNSWIPDAVDDIKAEAEATLSLPTLPQEARPRLEAIKTTADTIKGAAKATERKIGAPEEPKPYSRDEHAAVVVQANKDLDQQEAVKKGIGGFIENIVTKGADLLWPGLGGMVVGAWFWIRKKIAFDKFRAGVAPIVSTIEKHPDVKAKVAEYASKIGAGGAVKAVVDSMSK